ncbi:hypothetical protein RND71_006337 [Anisodus tanguticus]|uniref:Uncharacterized protein n=1 Tax=Anisodus tanguticus TaxID=243964 RepID=A0AAE1ST61_9SOLA|nr:hypothetical protein RND71_006337 [Anisodus tanguticus]
MMSSMKDKVCRNTMYRCGGLPFQYWFYECTKLDCEEQLVLSNIEPSCVEKTVLQLPAFELVIEEEDNCMDDSTPHAQNTKQQCKIDSADELTLLRRDFNCNRVVDHVMDKGKNIGESELSDFPDNYNKEYGGG